MAGLSHVNHTANLLKSFLTKKIGATDKSAFNPSNSSCNDRKIKSFEDVQNLTQELGIIINFLTTNHQSMFVKKPSYIKAELLNKLPSDFSKE